MESNVEVIVQLIGSLLLLGMMILPFLVFFIYVFYQNSKRKKIRERTSQAYQHMIGNNHVVPVRYCSEPRFKSWWKIFPWEGTGLLVPANGVVTFVGEHLNGSPLNLQFAPANCRVSWLGKCPWPNGAVSWFMFDRTGDKHYFTSETGAFILGSNNSTKAAFDQSTIAFQNAQLS